MTLAIKVQAFVEAINKRFKADPKFAEAVGKNQAHV